MNFIIDHYLLIGAIFGLLNLIFFGLNFVYKFTEFSIIPDFLTINPKKDFGFEFIVLSVICFYFSLLWPIVIVFYSLLLLFNLLKFV